MRPFRNIVYAVSQYMIHRPVFIIVDAFLIPVYEYPFPIRCSRRCDIITICGNIYVFCYRLLAENRKFSVLVQKSFYIVQPRGNVTVVVVSIDFFIFKFSHFIAIFIYKSPLAVFAGACGSSMENSKVRYSVRQRDDSVALKVDGAYDTVLDETDVAVIVVIEYLVIYAGQDFTPVFVLQSDGMLSLIDDYVLGFIHSR